MKGNLKPWLYTGTFLAAVLIGLIGILYLAGSAPLPITQTVEIGVGGPIILEFGSEMRIGSVEQRIAIQPTENYRLEWLNNQLLIWPQTRWQAGEQIHIEIVKGSQTTDNRSIRQTFTASVPVHAAEILFLSPALDASQVWRYQPGDAGSVLLDSITGGVEISASPDGSRIIESRINGEGGADLWSIPRFGGGGNRVVNCGKTWCGEVSWQPGENRFAYSQYELNGRGAPRIYTYDYKTGTSNPVMVDPSILASHPVFSPDGQFLAFYNLSENGITVLHLKTSKMQILETAMEQAVCWLPDSNGFLFLHSQALDGIPIEKIFHYNLATQSANIALGTQDDALSYGQPAVSYDGQWIAVPVRQVEGGFSSQVWLFDKQGNLVRVITDEPEYTHGSLSWSPDGQVLLFQRLKLNDSPPKPEVLTWNMQKDQIQLIARDANSAEWLP